MLAKAGRSSGVTGGRGRLCRTPATTGEAMVEEEVPASPARQQGLARRYQARMATPLAGWDSGTCWSRHWPRDCMAISPYRFIMVPRLLAAIISVPILTAFYNLIGIFGGYIVGVYLKGLSGAAYMQTTRLAELPDEIG